MAIVALVSLPFALQWAFVAATALGRDRYEMYATLEIVNAAIILVGGVALAIPFGILGAVSAFAASNVLTALLGAVWLRTETARAGDAGSGGMTGQLRRATKFGLQTWSANLLQLLNYRLDIFVLSSVAFRSTVGVYSIAVSVTALGWVLPNAFQTVLFPRVASLDAAAGAGQIGAGSSDAAAARAVRHSVLIVLPTIALLVILVLLVPLIYGSAFDRSVTLGFILIPGVAVAGVAKVASAVSSGRGFPRYALYTTALTVPATVSLYLLLIPAFHATGAAVASSISYTLTTVLTVYYFERATSIKLRAALIPARSDLVDYLDALRSARARLGRA
jgi:O-antigen/teichoic acid export membrane protein